MKSILKSLITPPPMQHHSFFSNLPPLTICDTSAPPKKKFIFCLTTVEWAMYGLKHSPYK